MQERAPSRGREHLVRKRLVICDRLSWVGNIRDHKRFTECFCSEDIDYQSDYLYSLTQFSIPQGGRCGG